MNSKVINLTPDFHERLDSIDQNLINHKLKGGPKKTEIIILDHDSGKELGRYENKIVVTGSVFDAANIFGINCPVTLPSYNKELDLDNSVKAGTEPKNNPVVCLFCVGDSGCGTEPKDVYVAKYTDRISPKNDIIPFKYTDVDHDLNEDQREMYFGRKEKDGFVSYYFKKFDSIPQMYLLYTDGTEINEQMYNVETTQSAECYVETRLKITRTDLRDYFEKVLGWKKARISTISLCYAWYDEKDGYKWYQDIYPYSKLNFSCEWLVDLNKAIDFIYRVYY